MALDPGSRRVGVALSDELGLLATPLAVVARRSRAEDLRALGRLIDQHRPAELLVGLPLLPSGAASSQTRYSERFAEILRQEFGLPVVLWNERYSSLEARERRRERPARRRRSTAVDAEAAAIFLQTYLDARR